MYCRMYNTTSRGTCRSNGSLILPIGLTPVYHMRATQQPLVCRHMQQRQASPRAQQQVRGGGGGIAG
jgi:hypothetical protein